MKNELCIMNYEECIMKNELCIMNYEINRSFVYH